MIKAKKSITLHIMNKVIKYNNTFSGQEITFTIDEKMNELKGKNLAPKKLDQANKMFRKLKHPISYYISQNK